MSDNVWLHLVIQNEEDVSFLLSQLSKTPIQTLGLHTSLGGALSTRQRNYISGDGDAVNMYLFCRWRDVESAPGTNYQKRSCIFYFVIDAGLERENKWKGVCHALKET